MSHTAQAGRATPYPDTAVLFRAEPRRSTPARDRRRSQSNGCGATLNYPPAETPKTPPTGIARLAAFAPKALERHQVEYFRLAVRSVLNPVNSRRVGFKWSINPYRGCEFGCHYCYARYTHEYMELDPRQFENKIYAKEQVAALLRRDLEQAGERLQGEHIAIGTATDPYQPAEQRFGVTRAVLETLLDFARSQPGRLSLSLATKSNLVLNDIELLRALARYSRFRVSFTVTTLNARLARVLEPRAPRPDLRLDAVRRLNYASVSSGVFVVPILPGLTDKPGDLEALVAAAAEARAAYLCAGVAFLMPSAQRKFFPLLEQKFPPLAKQYRKWFRTNAYAPQAYRTRISSLMRELRSKYNLPDHWPEDDVAPNYAAFASVEAAHPQLALPFAS
jgi:DNA repair photolyase